MAKPYYVYGGNLLNREKYTSVVNTYKGSELVQKRYFSSIDTDVYFGDLLIDEMVAFDFVIEERKIPIYGYNNFVPKRIITGQKAIQGSFAINFTRSYDMHYILESIAESLYATEYEEAQFFCADDNKALFDKGFDITISYGDDKDDSGFKSYNSCTQTLVGCYITSYRQAFDTSGEPILDMYTFIAKDLIVQISDPVDSTTEAEDDKYTVTEKDKEGESISTSEPYKIGNISVKGEEDAVFNYCKEHPETLGIYINPTYDYVDGASRMTLYVCPHNDIELKVESASIAITDIALTGSYSFKLNKKSEKWYYYHEMQGTHVNVGKKIKNMFSENTITELECVVYLNCNDGKKDYAIEYPTTLHLGTVRNY